MPGAKAYFENVEGIYMDNKLSDAGRSRLLMAGPALTVYYGNFSLQSSIEFPCWQKVPETELSSAGRIILGLTYSISQSKFLLVKQKIVQE